MILSLIAAAAVATPEIAAAETVTLASAPQPAMIADPEWVRTPSIEELISTFPVAAIQNGASGEAVIECQVSAEGALDGCYVITERGGDYGFGAATVQLAQYFRMAARSQSGEPTEGAMVRLPMIWKLN